VPVGRPRRLRRREVALGLLQVGARVVRLAQHALEIHLPGGLVHEGVREGERLLERKPDGAGERELVLGVLVFGHDQSLALRLELDPRAQDLDPGDDSRLLEADRMLVEGLRRGDLLADRLDPPLVRRGPQVGAGADEDDGLPRRGSSGARGGARKPRRVPQVVRLEVEERLREVEARVKDVERADEGRAARRRREAVRLEIDHLARSGHARGDRRELPRPRDVLRPLGPPDRFAARDRGEVRVEPADDGILQGQAQRLVGGSGRERHGKPRYGANAAEHVREGPHHDLPTLYHRCRRRTPVSGHHPTVGERPGFRPPLGKRRRKPGQRAGGLGTNHGQGLVLGRVTPKLSVPRLLSTPFEIPVTR